VAQGNATLIQFPGKERMLIDGGGFPRGRFDIGKMVVAPFLFHSKIARVDYIVLTHPQADHMNGLRFIAKNFRPKEFWYNGDSSESQSFLALMEIIDSKGIKKFLPKDLRGGRNISGVKTEVLHPPTDQEARPAFLQAMSLNDKSLVLKLSYGGTSFLFPGDLERPGEEMVISNAGPLLESDVLLAPHHGSRYSCSRRFLEMVRPRICVISSGSGNYAGFPHLQTLKRLKESGCRTIRIDQVGAVRLTPEQTRIKVKSFLKEPSQ
jgi:competence protein ComEC